MVKLLIINVIYHTPQSRVSDTKYYKRCSGVGMGVVGTIKGSNDDDHALKAKALVNSTLREVKSSLGTNLPK